MRVVCLFLNLTGLDRCVAASYGAQQQVNRQVEEAIVAYRQAESDRLAKDMPRTDMTLPQDETFTGSLCLVGSEPISNSIILEQLAQTRDQAIGNVLMAPALAALNCQMMQSTSDEAPGLLAYVAHHLGAHHSPDVFHVQHELGKAVCAPLATKVRPAHKAAAEAQEHGSGRRSKETVSREHAQQALEAASREHERLAKQREQVAQRLRAIGHVYSVVDLTRGVRRNGQLIVNDIQEQITQIRVSAEHEKLSQTCLDRIEKAARVAPKMRATIVFVSSSVGQQVRQLDWTPPLSYAMHAQLIPSYYPRARGPEADDQ